VPATVFDAASARALLLECIAAHRGLLPTPPPRVLLQDFDAATYAFELQVHVRDVAQMEEVASQLRFAADAAMRRRMPPPAAPPAPAPSA
jgi:small-conductance mechanosensitive channel